ncbi:ankyrin repeat-containing domain protein [Cercophora samala]|uniref:Ankyrin repeat-containing domain protein n=1 Tax=Cercophora samala TaxID=330535 RepID=A0AA39ZAT2_9PEZI|nr:ankyrin repeat-containing domain protein [Cercophora samala]
MSNYRERKAEFIRKEFHRLLATGTASVTSGLLRHKQGDSIRDVVIGKAMKFTGSFSEISCYISHLLQCFSCSAPAVIRQGIGRTPDTAGEFYRKRISLVNNTDNELRDWATSALSWVFLAARPLRIEELARATAIHPSRGGSNLRDIEEESTLDTQQDIRNNLSGFLCVEDGFVRIANPIARAVLREGTPYNAEQHRVTGRNGSISIGTRAALELLGDGDLVERCLTYLALLLSEQPEPSPIQEPFVDYAVRYWPTHFARIQDPGEDLCGQVVTFLRNSPVANGWFRLYLNWNSLSVTTLLDDEPTPSNVDRHTDSSGAKGTISPAVMASCVGLSQVMAQLLEGGDLEAENSEDGFLPTVLMKRGSLETQLAFRDAANCKLYLECAIAANNLSLVEMLLGNDKLQSGGRIISYQLMHMAARSGGLEMVKMLSQHPEVVQTSFHGDAEGRTAFHRAAARGHCNIIDHILISTRNHDGFGSADMSSLHMHPDHKGQTALTLALRGGNTDAALLLVQRAETDVPHNNLVNNLVNIPDNDGRTPIHHAVISSPLFLDKYMVEINRPAELEELLVTSDNSGLTPLHLAAREGCVEAICIILDFATRSDIANVVLLARDNRDQFPLHHAIQHGQSEIVGLLHELRTKGHASTCDYWYPLPDNLDGYITPEDLSAQQGQLDTLIKLHAGTANLTQSLLSAAAGAGQLLIVKYLLQHGLDPNMSSETSDDTPLGLAAAGGFTTVVRFLLDKGADINLADGGRKSPLYLAVENKRMEVVQALLNYHSPTRGSSPASPRSDSEDEQETSYFGHIIVDAPDSSRLTPLHVAASQGNTNLVSLLMKFGANVDSKSAELKTPLHLAVENNQLDVASLLVDKYGASISAQDEDGLHPVDYAIRKCQKDMFEVLIGYAADVERESTSADSRDTVYTVELQRRDLVTAIQCSAVDIVRLIVEQFSGIEDDCENRDSVLHIAARDSDGEMIKVLRNHFRGFDVNRTGSQGRTPIHAAVAHKNLEALKELLKVEPNLEQADDDGKTPLLLAVGKGMPPEICRVLLNKGARVDNLGPRGRGLTPLHIAAIHGNLPVMSELLKENPPLEAENDDHETPLLLCVGRGMDPGACKLLLEHGAQVNNAGKKNAQSPLYKAAYQGNPDTVEVLLQHAADVKWQDNGLWTALHAAMDNLAICRSLVEHGADLDAKKNDDWTPLHLGCYWSMPETVKLLLEKGAAPNPKNDDGNTPLHLALEMESLPVLQVMINHNVTCSTEYDNLRNPVDFGLPGAGGFLPIQVAIKQRSSEIKKVLLSVLRPREKDKNGSDYLDLALLKSDPAMLLFLLDEVEWDHDDIIRAYRRAIQEDTLSCFDVLVGKHSWLLKEEIADATHRVSGVDIRMLRELDLLIRNDSSSKLDYLVQRYLKRPCESDSPGSDKISDSTFDPTFRKLRLATELKTSVHWDALVSGARAQIDCDARDQDGWTIDDFIHQSRARLKLSVDDNQRPVRGTASSPTAMLLPRAWHRDGEQYDSRVEIGQDGLCITFHGGGWSSLPLCLRSDHPFAPYSRNAAYFEVKFESSNMNGMDGPSESMISVGLCGELADMTGAHSGWRPLSVGYHSDNGGLYLENGHRDTIHEKYGLGSTVGCGIDYETEELFFTLDGKIMIQRKCPNLIFRKLYPCVAQSYREAKVTVNFGSEKFAWEGANRRATRGISSGASVRVGRMSRVIQRRPTNLGPE